MTGVFDDASVAPEHPIAVYTIAGSVVSSWQLPPGQARELSRPLPGRG
jgi:hypothetical protein